MNAAQIEFLRNTHSMPLSDAKKRSKAQFMKTQKGKEMQRRITDRYRYGLEPGDYQLMLMAQAFRCAICNRHACEVGGRGRVLVPDHDHITGKMRQLLCVSCNGRLGWYEKHRKVVARYLGEPLNAKI